MVFVPQLVPVCALSPVGTVGGVGGTGAHIELFQVVPGAHTDVPVTVSVGNVAINDHGCRLKHWLLYGMVTDTKAFPGGIVCNCVPSQSFKSAPNIYVAGTDTPTVVAQLDPFAAIMQEGVEVNCAKALGGGGGGVVQVFEFFFHVRSGWQV
jgi:hypothetical protein